MKSQHDLFTAIITIVVLALTGVLVVTNHMNSSIATVLVTGLGMLFTYWFTRGGSLMQSEQTPSTTVDPTAIKNQVLQEIAQTPAVNAVQNQSAK